MTKYVWHIFLYVRSYQAYAMLEVSHKEEREKKAPLKCFLFLQQTLKGVRGDIHEGVEGEGGGSVLSLFWNSCHQRLSSAEWGSIKETFFQKGSCLAFKRLFFFVVGVFRSCGGGVESWTESLYSIRKTFYCQVRRRDEKGGRVAILQKDGKNDGKENFFQYVLLWSLSS